MFKNIQFFKINASWNQNLEIAERNFNGNRFVECGISQEESIGWTEPRGEKNGLLIEAIGGQWIGKLMFGSKILPSTVIKENVAKIVAKIEESTGRKLGKKEKKEITEDVRNDLVAKAFTKKSASFIWIDPVKNMLVIDTSSQSRADQIVTALVKSIESFVVTPIQTQTSSAVSMSHWLTTQDPPVGFTADQDCILKSVDATKASVKYAKHPLDIEEIRAHIANGKSPTQLAMTWDSRVSFVLTDLGLVKKISFLKTALQSKDESSFDADVILVTGELSNMIPAIVDALGGEIEVSN